jgi:hypothetical protein
LFPVLTVENITCGGSSLTTLKKEKGARLLIPLASIVEIQPIGLGITVPVNSLYKAEDSVVVISNCMV